MTITQLTKLIERLEAMAISAGISAKDAQALATRSIENAAGVGGVEVNITCAVDTMASYIDDTSSWQSDR